MSHKVARISAQELKTQIKDGGEIAILDAREEMAFGKRHLLLASCVPLSRMELMIDDLVPRRDTRVIWCDDGEGYAALAAERMAGLGYSDVSILDGGVAAWEAADFRIYSGVHVPSKAFAEVVEHDAGTPYITAQELKSLIDSKADIAIYDSRSYEEYNNNSIPDAISVPGAELVYRFTDLTPSPDTMVIVNCGGRTRSIIGAQSLINAGFQNRIVSLKDGTMAWHLAGFDVVNGATRQPPEVSGKGKEAARNGAAKVAALCDIARIDPATFDAWRDEADKRTLYILDVRTPKEYEAGHLPGVRSAPGGQLVQETDNHVAVWGARIVLVDDDGVRATMTASWLKQMGWTDIGILKMDMVDGPLAKGPHVPKALSFDPASVQTIDAADLRARLDAGSAVVVDFSDSRQYRTAHIPGAYFSTRARLNGTLQTLPKAEALVFTSSDGALAGLAATDVTAKSSVPVFVLSGGTKAWFSAGYPSEEGPTNMADEADDVWLSARELGKNREEAMREYLAWEIDLVNQMATDNDHRFQVATGSR